MVSVILSIKKQNDLGMKLGIETFKSPKRLPFDIVSYKTKMTLYLKSVFF